MNTTIHLPQQAIRFVLFQRTAYLAAPKYLLYRALNHFSPWQLIHFVVPLEAVIRKRRIEKLFNEDFAHEYETIRSALPDSCSAILDIGCGVGGIDVLLHRHYADSNLKYYLLDKTQVEKSIWYGFESRGAFYNSLEVARDVLTSNGIPDENIYLIPASEDCRIEIAQPIDLIISLISWGFHYPVETYLGRAYELLRLGGHLILDVRNGTNGEAVIQKKFDSVRRLEVTDKYTRILAVKKEA